MGVPDPADEAGVVGPALQLAPLPTATLTFELVQAPLDLPDLALQLEQPVHDDVLQLPLAGRIWPEQPQEQPAIEQAEAPQA